MAQFRRVSSREGRQDSAFLMLMRMGQSNTAAHLQPLADAVAPAILHVVRPAPRPEKLTASNVQYWDVHGRFRITEVLGTLLRGLRLAARFDIRLVMSFNAYPYGALAILISWATRAPVHIGFVGSDLKIATRRPMWWRLLANASFCTTPGPSSTAILRKLGYEGSIAELPHGVDPTRFNPGGCRDISCLFVGALIPRKRVDSLIKAMALVRARHPEARLVVVGEGPLRNELEALAIDLGADDLTTFVGQEDQPEIWMKRAEILAMPSEWEGLPYAMIEGMRCGAVPIVTPVGSVEDLISDYDNGRILIDRNPKTIADAITELLDDQAALRRMSRRAVESTEAYTFQDVSNAWHATLERVGIRDP